MAFPAQHPVTFLFGYEHSFLIRIWATPVRNKRAETEVTVEKDFEQLLCQKLQGMEGKVKN